MADWVAGGRAIIVAHSMSGPFMDEKDIILDFIDDEMILIGLLIERIKHDINY